MLQQPDNSTSTHGTTYIFTHTYSCLFQLPYILSIVTNYVALLYSTLYIYIYVYAFYVTIRLTHSVAAVCEGKATTLLKHPKDYRLNHSAAEFGRFRLFYIKIDSTASRCGNVLTGHPIRWLSHSRRHHSHPSEPTQTDCSASF